MTVTAPPAAHTGLPPISDDALACVESLTDTAFWQLMLGDDLDVCARDVDLLCASIKFRFAQILASYKAERSSLAESRWAEKAAALGHDHDMPRPAEYTGYRRAVPGTAQQLYDHLHVAHPGQWEHLVDLDLVSPSAADEAHAMEHFFGSFGR